MDKIVVERELDASVDKVWSALTDKANLSIWLPFLSDFEAKVGYSTEFELGKDKDHQYTHLIKVLEVKENKRLSYSWAYKGYEGDSRVNFDLSPIGNNKTKLVLSHEILKPFPLNNPDFKLSSFSQGWNYTADALAGYVNNNGLSVMDKQKGLKVIRLIDAPINTVWDAWTNESKIKDWWGPFGVTNSAVIWQAKPGGKINIVMKAGPELGALNGQEWPMEGEFKEVDPLKKLVYNSDAIMSSKPIITCLNTVLFEDMSGKTKLTIDISITKVYENAEGPIAGMEMGWNQSLDKFSKYLSV